MDEVCLGRTLIFIFINASRGVNRIRCENKTKWFGKNTKFNVSTLVYFSRFISLISFLRIHSSVVRCMI